ncbi:MAG: hypothetical protein ACD_62C00127G0010 [uncultured bacterium]|nr:MAG: hypothetical protein ACD_62C00127G0010 [uncultured bacterium]
MAIRASMDDLSHTKIISAGQSGGVYKKLRLFLIFIMTATGGNL